MIVFPGTLILHNGKKKVVVSTYEPNDNLPKGRCELMYNGHVEWHDTRIFDARLVEDEFPKFVEVSQHNYRKKNKDGRCSLYHKAPKDMLEAMIWSIEMGSIRFLDVKDCGWGNGLYRVLEDGALEFIHGDWDSSG